VVSIDRDEIAARVLVALIRAQPDWANSAHAAGQLRMACKAMAGISYAIADEMIEVRKDGLPCLALTEEMDARTCTCLRCGKANAADCPEVDSPDRAPR
jgi:hypothetical protein